MVDIFVGMRADKARMPIAVDLPQPVFFFYSC